MKFQNLLLNIVVDHIAYPLHEIINQSLKSRKFPEKLKFSSIKTIFKKDDRNKMENCFTVWATGIGTQLSTNPSQIVNG